MKKLIARLLAFLARIFGIEVERDTVRDAARVKVRNIGNPMLFAYGEQYVSRLYQILELQRDNPNGIHAAQLAEGVSVLAGVVDEVVERQREADEIAARAATLDAQ